MKSAPKNSLLSLALATSLVGSVTWSTDSHACAAAPFLGSVCIMATPPGYGSFSNTYVPAMGQPLQIRDRTALFAVVGATWGGDGRSNFNLPNLAGRIAMGSGRSPVTGVEYSAGQAGGAESALLTAAQLPVHAHTFAGASVDISKLTATTTLSGLSASLTGNLVLKASAGGTSANDPTGRSLATTTGPIKIYSDAAPAISMNAASIDSSNLHVGGISGTATTTLGGTAGVSGVTAAAGGGAPMSLMQPYLVMNYYVAVNGTFPARD